MIKIISITLAIALGIFCALPIHAQDKKTVTEKTAATGNAKDAAEEKEKEGKGLEIGKLLPLNKPNLRVKIPGFDQGELSTMVEAEKLTRIDDVNLELEEATIQLVPQALTIKLRTGLYNTEGAILSSNDATTISSKEFTLTGDTLDFDTKTGKGRMTAKKGGRIRMLVHNVSMMSGEKDTGKKQPADATKETQRSVKKTIQQQPKK